jgi:2-haloacid dehalogenase
MIGDRRMSIVRREFLMAGLCVTSTLFPMSPEAQDRHRPSYKAIAFDAFAVFDPRPVAALCETLFPDKGTELFRMWRLRQFEYTWLRTILNRYVDFAQVTDEALVFAANTLKLEIDPAKRRQLGKSHFELKAWPDAIPVLTQLKEAGIKLAFLSNFTANMLNSCIESSGLGGVIDHVLSSDLARTYKPHWRAYQLGVDALKLPKDEILFVAFAGWDAAGAKSFGYPTFWANRLGLPQEELGVSPDEIGASLIDLLRI